MWHSDQRTSESLRTWRNEVVAIQTYTISFPEPEDPPVSVPSAAYHYLHDVLGSVIGLVDETGGLRERYTYDPYGKVFIEHWGEDPETGGAWLASAETTSGMPHSSVGNPFLWTGHRYDAAVGLYATHFRTYLPPPMDGRYPDPGTTQTWPSQ